MVLWFAKAACGLALARKSSHNPTTHFMPLFAISQKMAARSEDAPGGSDFAGVKKVMPYLLELLDSTLVNTTALVDQVCMPM